jgi:hypothetical protein
MAIERFSLLDKINGSTYFAVNINAQDYRASAGSLSDFVKTAIGDGDGKILQYAGPTSTGFTVPVTDSSSSVCFGAR